MPKVIIFTNSNGGVSVCTPTGELPVEQVQAEHIPPNVISYIIESSSLPENDDDFFDAWEQNNGVVTVNILKAKEITKARLRLEREPLFAAQDVLFQRAIETGADTSTIVAEKNRLRDITTLVDTVDTLSSLRFLKAAA